MKTKTKRIVSLILALVMIFGAIPMSSIVAFAGEHTHSWSYAANAATKTITASCGCGTFYAKIADDSKDYDTTPLTVSAQWVDGDDVPVIDPSLAELSVTYYKCKLDAENHEVHGDAVEAPITAGKYFAVLSAEDQSVESLLTINKKNIANAEIYLDDELVVEGEGKHYIWNNYNHKPEIVVKIDGIELTAKTEFVQVGDYIFSGVTRQKEVGAYLVHVTAADNSNYTGEQNFTWYIDQVPSDGIDEEATTKEFTYDGSPKDFVIALNDTNEQIVYSDSEDGTYSETPITGTDAGTYTVYYKIYQQPNDTVHGQTLTGSIDFVINPASVSVPAAQEDAVYTGSPVGYDPQNSDITVSYFKKNADGEYEAIDADDACECGYYKIVLSLDSNHKWATEDATEFEFEIYAASLELTLYDAYMTYGDSIFSFENNLVYEFVNGTPEDFTYTIKVYDEDGVEVDPINYHALAAGEYTIKIEKTNENLNYGLDPACVVATLYVAQKDVTVEITSSESTWGDDPSITYSVDGLVNGDSIDVIEVTADVAADTDAGSYPISASDTTGNYNITNADDLGDYVISQRDVSTLTGSAHFVIVDQNDEIIEGYEYANNNFAPPVKLLLPEGSEQTFLPDAYFEANFETRGQIDCAHVGIHEISIDAKYDSTNWTGTATIYYYISPVKSSSKVYAGINNAQILDLYLVDGEGHSTLTDITVKFSNDGSETYTIPLTGEESIAALTAIHNAKDVGTYDYYYTISNEDGSISFNCKATLEITPYVLTDIEFTTQLNLIRLLYTGEAQVPTDISLGGIDNADIDHDSYKVLAYADDTYTNPIDAINCGIYYAEFTVEDCEKHNYVIGESVATASLRHEFEIYSLIPVGVLAPDGAVVEIVNGQDVEGLLCCDNASEFDISIKIAKGYVPTENLSLNFLYIANVEELSEEQLLNIFFGTPEYSYSVPLALSGVSLDQDGEYLNVTVPALGRVDAYCTDITLTSAILIVVDGIVPVVEFETNTIIGVNPDAETLEEMFEIGKGFVEFSSNETYKGDLKLRVNSDVASLLDLGADFGGVTNEDKEFTIFADKNKSAHSLAVVDNYGRKCGYLFDVVPQEVYVTFVLEGCGYDIDQKYVGDSIASDELWFIEGLNVTWYTDEECTSEADIFEALTEDVTFYGVVERDPYDFNCDGEVDINDAMYLLNHFAFGEEYAIYNNANTDIDESGSFTVEDIEALLNIINA